MKTKIILLILLCLNINLYAKNIDITILNPFQDYINVNLKKQILDKDGNLYGIVQFKSVSGKTTANYGCKSSTITYTSEVVYNDNRKYEMIYAKFVSPINGKNILQEEKKLFLGHDFTKNFDKKIILTIGCAND